MGCRLLRKRSETRRIIWRHDDALASVPGLAWVDESEATLVPEGTPCVFTVHGLGNSEMARIHALVGAGELSTELAQFLMAAQAVQRIEHGEDVVDDPAEIRRQLEEEYPWDMRVDLAREVLYMAEGGPPGARRFRRAGHPDAVGAARPATGPDLQGVPS